MKKFFLFVSIFGFGFSFVNLCFADTSNIERLVFITEPQTVVPNEISRYLTLQIQDASGNQVSALETIRFDAFETTSPTGVFVSCTTPTNPPTDYLSKNGSNKNICYRDSTEGVYTITAKTNNTVNSLLATQTITVSASTVGGGDGETTTTTGTTTTGTSTSTSTTNTTTTISSGSGSSYYVYSSSVSLSTYEPLDLNVEAGRERLGFLHTPLQFKSYAKDKKTGKNISGAKYLWTFGDGTSGEGEEIVHTYLFPGEYNVVLNSSLDNEEAVDITKVKIVPPEVKMSLADLYIEFANEKSTDLNIGGWKISGNNKEYLIPKDTIISANSSIKIPDVVIKDILSGEKVSLVYPDNQLAFETDQVLDNEKKKQISEISQKLLSIKNELDYAYTQNIDYTEFADSEGGVGVFGTDTKMGVENENKDALLANSISAPATKGVVSKILDFFATMFK